jgi:hypothetical protein
MFPPPALVGIFALALAFTEVDAETVLRVQEPGSWHVPTIFWDQPA